MDKDLEQKNDATSVAKGFLPKDIKDFFNFGDTESKYDKGSAEEEPEEDKTDWKDVAKKAIRIAYPTATPFFDVIEGYKNGKIKLPTSEDLKEFMKNMANANKPVNKLEEVKSIYDRIMHGAAKDAGEEAGKEALNSAAKHMAHKALTDKDGKVIEEKDIKLQPSSQEEMFGK